MVLSGDFEFSNSKITSEKSFIMRLLLMFELDVIFRVGIGIEAVVSKGLFIGESILSAIEFELLAKGVGGESAPDDEGGDKSKSGDEVSNLRKLFDEELQS